MTEVPLVSTIKYDLKLGNENPDVVLLLNKSFLTGF